MTSHVLILQYIAFIFSTGHWLHIGPVLAGKLAHFYAFFYTASDISYVYLCGFNCFFHLAQKKVAGPPIGFNDVCACE